MVTKIKKQWRKGKAASLKFYEMKAHVKAKVFNKIFPLESYFAPMIGDKKEVYIADFGAGMFSTTGSTWDGVAVHLFPSDILADDFAKILKVKGIVPEIPVKKEDMEKLSYPDNYFDIVHSVNALDHCSDPLAAINEMQRVLRPGGWIYLKHYMNNAHFQHYKGFHEWNISPLKDDLYIWSRDDSFILSKEAGWHVSLEVTPGETPDTKVIAVYQKPI